MIKKRGGGIGASGKMEATWIVAFNSPSTNFIVRLKFIKQKLDFS
ncbi:TPA: hypothetical protein ACSJUJ_002387 [Legionella pneumophila]|nr:MULTISPECIES: hypothetical protein [Legionellaceae]MDW8880484.1 hypothetical protein [Legionella pneumophila subsp. fraseri]MCW8403922.1 hypothetical protein [Legionella pneumophila]MCW8407317.1 hypothetical protein [Legionella pneumophila]MCW8422990.1 hypothetical protein [Legionella sp. PATHC032]MCW8430034.1 hypothetical protein [Legionella pneumophila]